MKYTGIRKSGNLYTRYALEVSVARAAPPACDSSVASAAAGL
tara:strand:- start:137767 stop:137892 length:126 start_codon:yes stop_codon:yes gene_type:complete